MRVALACLLLAGCDQLWNLDHIDTHDDAGRDATVSDGIASDAPSDASACPSTFTYNPVSQTYYLLGPTADWFTARAACKTEPHGAGWFTHLAVIGNFAEYTAVYNSSLDVATYTPWVGAFDTDNGDGQPQFRWVTDEPGAETLWGSMQPDQPDSQNCARMWVPQGMDNEQCGVAYRYLCECDQFADIMP